MKKIRYSVCPQVRLIRLIPKTTYFKNFLKNYSRDDLSHYIQKNFFLEKKLS